MTSTHDAPHVLVATGRAGAGRSSAGDVLEGVEYVWLGTLPPSLSGAVVKAHDIPAQHTRPAVVIDSRSGLPFEEIRESLNALGRDNILTRIVFLDADDDVIIKRYEENRRPHPLGHDTIAESIAAEREMTEQIGRAHV